MCVAQAPSAVVHGFQRWRHQTQLSALDKSCPQVELIEMPFTVITCPDILLVNLERVGFNLRNFDMTIVFKVCRLLFVFSRS